MQRITLWITATLTVIALVSSYQANTTGTAKHGDGVPGVTTEHMGKPGESK